MEKHICSCCGASLEHKGNQYVCPYCDSVFEDDYEEKAAYTLKGLLDEAKMEKLSNHRKALYDAAHAKYPSREAVISASNEVLSVNPDDALAKVYLYSHDRDSHRLNTLLAGLSVSKPEAEEVVRWLLPSLTLRNAGALHDFADRHFRNEEKTRIVTQIEKEAEKSASGIYEVGMPRDVFLCYSSADMPKVIEVMDELERNGFSCFAAFRNLRHGLGASENYLSGIKTAMRSCEVLVFLSSDNSRSVDCDALKVELPYLISELPNKPRVEYILEDYGDDVPYMVRKTLKKAFPEQEHCRGLEDLLDRVSSALESKDDGKEREEALKRQAEEARAEAEKAKAEAEEAKRLAQLEAQRRQDEEAKRKLAESRQDTVKKPEPWKPSQTEAAKATPSIGIPTQFVSANVNDVISFGKYDQEVFDEPIEWLVLDKTSDYLLVVSSKLLDYVKYHDQKKVDVTWDTSFIRGWLNKEFLETAFSPAERDLILNAPISRGDNVKYKLKGGVETTDRVFLLSIDEIEKYFPKEASRVALYTKIAKGKSSNLISKAGWYWLRCPGTDKKSAAGVKANGKFDLFGFFVTSGMGVRPALRIRLK